ncbi:MAG: hypothetical protein LQ339_007212 [Xanthoria mediterranea]|nr:MAG: hypothetical protein LQ339_007212 [Xanthoria mediterranea]
MLLPPVPILDYCDAEASDTIPVHFSKPFTQSSAKENTDVSDLNDDGKSNDAISSVPSGHKLGFIKYQLFKKPRKPSPEAEKLQLQLHEKFVAQRRKDAIALQLSDGNPGESRTLPSTKLAKKGKKEKKLVIRKKVREVKRATKKALDLRSSSGSKQSPPQSMFERASPGSLFSAPNTEKVAGKRARKSRKKQLSETSSDDGPSTKLLDTETTHDEVSAAAKPPGSGQDLEATSPANGRSLSSSFPKSSSQGRTKPKTKKKSARLSKIKTPSESRRKVRKITTGEKNLNVRRLVSKGPPMPPLKSIRITKRLRKVASIGNVAKDGSVKSRNRSRPAAAKTKVTSSIENIDASELKISALDLDQPPVPHLSYGLERVLFNPGIYHLQDPRSRVYNFDPYLQTIMPVAEFNFDALKEYITSSRDTALQELAASYDKRYVGSSSSMTGILAHFHFLLSQWRSINTRMLSREFPDQQSSKFTEIQRSPSAIFLKWRNGSYAIDADKEFAGANVLMLLGKSMEKLLTLKTEDYEKYRKSSSGKVSKEEQNAPESYHYSTMGDFIMRSQLDAHDPRLPGTGMFDLKTRAVVSVRMDASHFEEGAGYQIKSRQGAWESFEREYFDMIRSAFLKYSLQVRMGRMDGIFVAFHNTDRIFGFQYISLSEMDSTLHGQWDMCLGDQEFKLSIALLNDVLNKATKKYPNTSLRLHFETREAQTPFMYIFAEPVTEEQITKVQTANDAKIQEFEQQVCGAKEEEDQGWENLQANVQDAMDEDLRDPNHDEGRQDLDPILTSTKKDNARQLASSDDSSPVDPNNPITTAAAEDEEDMDDDDSDEDEGREEEDEEDEEDDDETEEQDDDDEVVPEGILVDNAVGRDTETYADARSDIEERYPQHEVKDRVMAPTIAENREELATGAGEQTKERGVGEESTKAESPEGSDSKSSSAIASDSKAESAETDAAMEGFDGENGDDSQKTVAGDRREPSAGPEGKEVLALTLTIRNKVNKSYVLRPENLGAKDQWTMEYSLDEVSKPDRAWSLYQACQMRRKKKLDDVNRRGESDDEVDAYIRRLREMSRKGAEWRKKQDEKDRALPVQVLG